MNAPLFESNTPEFSVSDLSNALKRTLEDRFGFVRVRGEVSAYKGPHASGHVYFDLKDENSVLASIIWKGQFNKMPMRPENGMEIIATGKISTFPKKSGYQLIIESFEPAGAGALLAMLEERKKRLSAEGLFAPERKQLLPFLPKTIALITSPTGSVLHDMMRVFEARYPCHIIICPAKVQGDGAEIELVNALQNLEAMSVAGQIPTPDVVIIARGGGSLEDLMCFNSEAVVRAVANCPFPTISGVGHETDTTLVDFAADIRATTPTQAAQIATPVLEELVNRVADLDKRLKSVITRKMQDAIREMNNMQRIWRPADQLFAPHNQKLDYASERFNNAFSAQISKIRGRFNTIHTRVSPFLVQGFLVSKRQSLAALSTKLVGGLQRTANASRVQFTKTNARFTPNLVLLPLQKRAQTLNHHGQMLNVLSYKATLKRGYVLARDENGTVIRSAQNTPSTFTIEWHDGVQHVKVEK